MFDFDSVLLPDENLTIPPAICLMRPGGVSFLLSFHCLTCRFCLQRRCFCNFKPCFCKTSLTRRGQRLTGRPRPLQGSTAMNYIHTHWHVWACGKTHGSPTWLSVSAHVRSISVSSCALLMCNPLASAWIALRLKNTKKQLLNNAQEAPAVLVQSNIYSNTSPSALHVYRHLHSTCHSTSVHIESCSSCSP